MRRIWILILLLILGVTTALETGCKSFPGSKKDNGPETVDDFMRGGRPKF